MSEDKIMTELEKKLCEDLDTLKKENQKLKKALESRDIPFNKQLLYRVDSKFYDLSYNIGAAIASAASQDLIQQLKHKKFILDYESSSYGKSGYFIRFLDHEQEKKFKELLAELELKRFQEALDNFSWAVQNQGG